LSWSLPSWLEQNAAGLTTEASSDGVARAFRCGGSLAIAGLERVAEHFAQRLVGCVSVQALVSLVSGGGGRYIRGLLSQDQQCGGEGDGSAQHSRAHHHQAFGSKGGNAMIGSFFDVLRQSHMARPGHG
jgi:hypothetical protein